MISTKTSSKFAAEAAKSAAADAAHSEVDHKWDDTVRIDGMSKAFIKTYKGRLSTSCGLSSIYNEAFRYLCAVRRL